MTWAVNQRAYRVHVVFPGLPADCAIHNFRCRQAPNMITAARRVLEELMGRKGPLHGQHPRELWVNVKCLEEEDWAEEDKNIRSSLGRKEGRPHWKTRQENLKRGERQ